MNGGREQRERERTENLTEAGEVAAEEKDSERGETFSSISLSRLLMLSTWAEEYLH